MVSKSRSDVPGTCTIPKKQKQKKQNKKKRRHSPRTWEVGLTYTADPTAKKDESLANFHLICPVRREKK